MEGEGAVPFFAPDAPEDGIIFQSVADLRLHGRQEGFEIAQDLLLLQPLHRGVQGREDRGNGGLFQNVIGAAQINRQAAPVEDQRQDPLVARVRGDDADVPIAASGADQRHDLLRRALAFVKNAVTAQDRQMPLQLLLGLDGPLKEPAADIAQIVFALLDSLDLNGDLQGLAGQDQLLGGLTGLFKGRMLRIDAVCRQAHGDPGRKPQQMLHDGHMLPGQVRKAVYVKFMVPGKIAAFQLLQQPVHLVPGVRLALGADAVVALQDQRQLLQFLGQGAACLLRGKFQVLGADAAALEFIHGIQQAGQKFRPRFHGSVGFELAGKLPGGGSHRRQTAAVVQTLRRHELGLLRHPAQEPGEGQDLCIAAGGVTGGGAETALGVVADQLRDHQDPVSPARPDVLGNILQNPLPTGDPVGG